MWQIHWKWDGFIQKPANGNAKILKLTLPYTYR